MFAIKCSCWIFKWDSGTKLKNSCHRGYFPRPYSRHLRSGLLLSVCDPDERFLHERSYRPLIHAVAETSFKRAHIASEIVVVVGDRVVVVVEWYGSKIKKHISWLIKRINEQKKNLCWSTCQGSHCIRNHCRRRRWQSYGETFGSAPKERSTTSRCPPRQAAQSAVEVMKNRCCGVSLNKISSKNPS